MPGIRMTYYNRFTNEDTFRNADGSMPRVIGNPAVREAKGIEVAEAVENEFSSPLDPRGAWGSRGGATFVQYRDLPGDKSRIPRGAIGYKMDSASSASTWSGNSYSYTNIGGRTVTTGELFVVYVWCYVSEDFNGEWARISCEGSASAWSYYNLSNKGTWQLLRATVTGSGDGTVSTFLYWTKSGGTTFSAAGLTGHVIYLAPMFHRLDHHYTPFAPGSRDAQHIEIPVAGNFPGYSGGSAIFFVRPHWAYNAGSGLGWPRLFSVDDPDGTRVFNGAFSYSSDEFYLWGDGVSAGVVSTHSTDERVAIVYTWDESEMRTSLNGSAFDSISWTPPALGSRVWIGDDMSAPGVRCFNGIFEEVAFLDTPITSRMVSHLYNDIFIPGKQLNNAGFLN